jgi:hypothetical protein
MLEVHIELPEGATEPLPILFSQWCQLQEYVDLTRAD